MNSQFYLNNEEFAAEAYHYKISGLDNVYLLNGFSVIYHDGEEGVSVHDVEGLHRAIGRHLVLHRKVLEPTDVRFLRKTMGLTQTELANKMSYDSQSVARWEKGRCEIPGAADKLLRILYLAENVQSEDDQVKLHSLIVSALDELEARDDHPEPQAQFAYDHGWIERELIAA